MGERKVFLQTTPFLETLKHKKLFFLVRHYPDVVVLRASIFITCHLRGESFAKVSCNKIEKKMAEETWAERKIRSV